MKKSLLFISILFCFCQVFAGRGNAIVQKQLAISSLQKDLCVFGAVNYPHTELEIHHHIASTSSNCRQQNVQSFVGTAETAPYLPLHSFTNTHQTFTQVWCKQYLSHIYPSHNYW